ncbi:hypothetical protein REPUB_Repub05bG0033500 [Reevesia pubescens]
MKDLNHSQLNKHNPLKTEGRKGGAGIVIRNNAGAIMAVGSLILSNMNNGFDVEASAAYKALELAHDLGFNNVLLEGDALSIISRLKLGGEDLSSTGLYIEETRALASTFSKCEFVHTARSRNMLPI